MNNKFQREAMPEAGGGNSDKYIPVNEPVDFDMEAFKKGTEVRGRIREIVSKKYNGKLPEGWGLIAACVQEYAAEKDAEIASLQSEIERLRSELYSEQEIKQQYVGFWSKKNEQIAKSVYKFLTNLKAQKEGKL